MTDTWPREGKLKTNAAAYIDSATIVPSDRTLFHDGGIFCFFSTKELTIKDKHGKELTVTHYIHNKFHIHCTRLESKNAIISFYTNGSYIQSAYCEQLDRMKIIDNPPLNVHRSRLRYIKDLEVGTRALNVNRYQIIVEKAHLLAEAVVLEARTAYWFVANEPLEAISNNTKLFSVSEPKRFEDNHLYRIESRQLRCGVLWFCFADGHMERVANEQKKQDRQSTKRSRRLGEKTLQYNDAIASNTLLLPSGHIPFTAITLSTKIGEGSYGIIYLAEWNNKKHAVKRFKFSDVKKDDVLKESDILRPLQHECIVSFVGVTTNPKTDESMMVMEYLEDGSLDDLLHSGTLLARDVLLQIALDVAEGLRYLHSQKIIHRDLKSANVLLYNNRTRAKITDFGTARILSNSSKASTITGTVGFMAPEILQELRYDAKADVYSFGVLLFQMLTKKSLPILFTDNARAEKITSDVNDVPFQEFIINCCKMEPTERPTIEECISILKNMQHE